MIKSRLLRVSFTKVVLLTFLLCQSFFGDHAFAQNGPLHLQIAGDAKDGFYVNVYEGKQLRITRTEEFSIKLFNLDLTTTAHWNRGKVKNGQGMIRSLH